MNGFKSFDEEFFDKIIRFFLFLIAFWLPYSPAIIESSVACGLLVWIVKRIVLSDRHEVAVGGVKGRFQRALDIFKPKASPLNFLIGFFLLIAFLSTWGSLYFHDSIRGFFSKTMEWFVVYYLVLESFTRKEHFRPLLIIFIVTTLATVCDSFYQYYFTHKDIFFGHEIITGDRATAGFKTGNSLGGYLTVAVPVMTAVFIREKAASPRKWVAGGIVFFCAWSLGLSYTRGAIFGVTLGVVLVVLLLSKNKIWFYRALAVFLTTAFAYLTFSDTIHRFCFERAETVGWRLQVWQDTLTMIAERPWFGHGINSFMKVFWLYQPLAKQGPTFAHNCYLQVAAETGLLGLVAFLSIIARILAAGYGQIEKSLAGSAEKPVAAGLYGGIAAFLVHSFFDTNFYSLQLSVLFWFSVGVIMAFDAASSTNTIKTDQQRKR